MGADAKEIEPNSPDSKAIESSSNETIALAMLVGYCVSALYIISDYLGDNFPNKASAKVHEAIKFVKDKTNSYYPTHYPILEAESNDL